MTVKLGIFGTKGGIGKTKAAITLAYAYTRLGYSVAVEDYDNLNDTASFHYSQAQQAQDIEPAFGVYRAGKTPTGNDIIIQDFPASFVLDAKANPVKVLKACKLIVMPVTPDPETIRLTIKNVTELTKIGIVPNKIAIAFNQVKHGKTVQDFNENMLFKSMIDLNKVHSYIPHCSSIADTHYRGLPVGCESFRGHTDKLALELAAIMDVSRGEQALEVV